MAVLLGGFTAAGQGLNGSLKIRPIQDFLKAQGQAPAPAPYNSNVLFADPTTGMLIAVDYAGLVNKWVEEQSDGAVSFGTRIEGTVIERPLPDGRAEVTVVCHARNAIVAVMVWPESDPWVTYLFGNDPHDIVAGAPSGVGVAVLKWVFINEAPGAPLPDLLTEHMTGFPHEFIRLSLEANAAGPLKEASGYPEGTPGRAQVTQVGLFQASGKGATSDHYPVEHIKLHAVGR